MISQFEASMSPGVKSAVEPTRRSPAAARSPVFSK